MDSYSPEDLKRLGRRVRERRLELGLTQAKVVAAGGPSISVLSKIETGAREYGDRVITSLEKVLQWERGSVEAILTGGEPGLKPGSPGTATENLSDFPDFVGDDPFYRHIWSFTGVPEDEREYAILRVQVRRLQRSRGGGMNTTAGDRRADRA